MAFVFTFLLVAGLEIAAANDDQSPEPPAVEVPEDPDMCVGCDDEKEEEQPTPELIVEIHVDPVTGKIQYIVRGLVIE